MRSGVCACADLVATLAAGLGAFFSAAFLAAGFDARRFGSGRMVTSLVQDGHEHSARGLGDRLGDRFPGWLRRRPGGGRQCGLRLGEVADRLDPLAGNVQCRQVLDQRIEAGIPGDDGETGARVLRRQPADIEGDVEIERVLAAAGDLDVFGIAAERLQCLHQFQQDLRLARAEEHLDPARSRLEQAEVPGLRVLEVDEDEIRLQARPLAARAATGRSVANLLGGLAD